MNVYEVIKRPLITEKSTACQADSNQYFFAVDTRAGKQEIRDAVEKVFKVNVVAVRTMSVGGKKRRIGRSVGRTSAWKKAMITLKEGERIEFLEGA
jgi:large subunit ribosomal protein L23